MDSPAPPADDRTFTQRVILLTGASEGIGRALALALAPERPLLVLVARNGERLASLAAECRAAGAGTLVIEADLTDAAACRRVVAATLAEFGRLDVLVNNAGATMWTRFDAMAELGLLEHLMRLNYLAPAWLTHAALPALKASRGRLVAVASMAGLTGVPERSAYAASKHALVGFFESLRIELADSGVTVTIVAPDFVRTETHKRAIGASGRPLGHSPLEHSRIQRAEDCAAMIVRAMRRRQRLLLTSLRGRAGYWLKWFAPRLIDRIAARAIRERR